VTGVGVPTADRSGGGKELVGETFSWRGGRSSSGPAAAAGGEEATRGVGSVGGGAEG
jgi:hypothetical protein